MTMRLHLPPEIPDSQLLRLNGTCPASKMTSNDSRNKDSEVRPLVVDESGSGKSDSNVVPRAADFFFAENLREFFGCNVYAVNDFLIYKNNPKNWGRIKRIWFLFSRLGTF